MVRGVRPLVFKNKREQWDWMQKRMPEIADFVKAVHKEFGKLGGVKVYSNRFEDKRG